MSEWILLTSLGCAAALAGFVCCFVPVLSGPAVSYAALWALVALGHAPSNARLTVGAVALAVVTVVDYVLPGVCAKRFHCSRWGVFGCLAGSLVGLFFLPFGIILGPFLGTVAGELIAGKALGESLRGGFGALLGFVLCLGLKLASVGVFAWWYFEALPSFPAP